MDIQCILRRDSLARKKNKHSCKRKRRRLNAFLIRELIVCPLFIKFYYSLGTYIKKTRLFGHTILAWSELSYYS